MLQIQVREDKLEQQSFLGGELYYNTAIPKNRQHAFTQILTEHYFPTLERLLDENKNEPTIVQGALIDNFFKKFATFKEFEDCCYYDSELDAQYKQGEYNDIAGAVDLVLKKDGEVFAIIEAKKPHGADKKSENRELITTNFL